MTSRGGDCDAVSETALAGTECVLLKLSLRLAERAVLPPPGKARAPTRLVSQVVSQEEMFLITGLVQNDGLVRPVRLIKPAVDMGYRVVLVAVPVDRHDRVKRDTPDDEHILSLAFKPVLPRTCYRLIDDQLFYCEEHLKTSVVETLGFDPEPGGDAPGTIVDVRIRVNARQVADYQSGRVTWATRREVRRDLQLEFLTAPYALLGPRAPLSPPLEILAAKSKDTRNHSPNFRTFKSTSGSACPSHTHNDGLIVSMRLASRLDGAGERPFRVPGALSQSNLSSSIPPLSRRERPSRPPIPRIGGGGPTTPFSAGDGCLLRSGERGDDAGGLSQAVPDTEPAGVGETGVMARTWLSIRVDLIHGGGQNLWPRPGRVFAARRTHTFLQLGEAIDTAFARWDRSHLTLFRLPDEHELYGPIAWEDPPENATFAGDVKLSRLAGGDQFTYTFDMGDDWTHLCTVAAERVDPLLTLGIIPDDPLAFWGWGQIPDQYGRLSEDDEQPAGPDPEMQDLPSIHPYWGPREPLARMAATALPALDVAVARHFCEQRIPPRALQQVRLDSKKAPERSRSLSVAPRGARTSGPTGPAARSPGSATATTQGSGRCTAAIDTSVGSCTPRSHHRPTSPKCSTRSTATPRTSSGADLRQPAIRAAVPVFTAARVPRDRRVLARPPAPIASADRLAEDP